MPRGLNILVAEDERSVAIAIEFALRCEGRSVEVATTGELALARITANAASIDVLITDHSMPGLNGLDLVRAVRERAHPIRVVVLSAHLPAESRAAYASMDVDAMISNPFDVASLRQTVNAVVR